MTKDSRLQSLEAPAEGHAVQEVRSWACLSGRGELWTESSTNGGHFLHVTSEDSVPGD